jgi:hypothetical protein
MNPWFSGMYGNTQPYGFIPQLPYPTQTGWAYSGGFTPQIPPQTWYGNPVGQFGPFGHPLLQQIPQLVQNAHQIAQLAPPLVQQLPQLIQQNPQLVQQAPQLQHVPQLLQQAAILAQQVPQVLQALCSFPQGAAYGAGPVMSGGFRAIA